MSSQQLQQYSGSQRGAAAEAYYQQWQSTVALMKLGPVSAAMACRLFAFFSGAVPQSDFYTWCCVHVLPLAQAIQSDARHADTAAEQQAVYARHIAAYDRVFDLFKATYCRAGPHEFQQLVLELRGVCNHNEGAALWRSLGHVLRKLHLFYSGVTHAGVVPAAQLFTQMLNTNELLPDAVTLRLKMAVDGLPQAQLPVAPADAPADYSPCLTFQAVLAAVQNLACEHESLFGWGIVSAGAGYASMQSSSSMGSQQPAVGSSNNSSGSAPAKLAIVDAVSLSRSLGHLSAEMRCQALAVAYPSDLCPEHSMLHALRDCPLVQLHDGGQQQVHSTSCGGVRMCDVGGVLQLQHKVHALLSSFATSHGGDQYDRPECALCRRLGHVVDDCWILHPGRCPDVRVLAGIYVPHNLRALFEQRLHEAHVVLPPHF
jgi:hypothetical protein